YLSPVFRILLSLWLRMGLTHSYHHHTLRTKLLRNYPSRSIRYSVPFSIRRGEHVSYLTSYAPCNFLGIGNTSEIAPRHVRHLSSFLLRSRLGNQLREFYRSPYALQMTRRAYLLRDLPSSPFP